MSLRRAIAALAASLALAAPLLSGCNDASPGGSSGAPSDAKAAPKSFEVVVLDDVPDPFATLEEPVPKGISKFQEVVVLGPEQVELRSYVRLVIQPGEAFDQAMARAKPWFDKRALPAGDRLIFSQITEENEVTKKREPVGARTFVATSKTVLTRADLAKAAVTVVADEDGKPVPVAMIDLTPDATERFRAFTKENALKRIAVLVGGNVVMSARIQEEITGGKISISVDPDAPPDVRKAELQGMVNDLFPPAPAASGAASAGASAK